MVAPLGSGLRRCRRTCNRHAECPRPGDVPNPDTLMKFGISQSVTRKEDAPLLRGAGRYVADVAGPGALHAVVLRAPHAHARFRITDTGAARALPGARLVLTAQDPAVAA